MEKNVLRADHDTRPPIGTLFSYPSFDMHVSPELKMLPVINTN
jgi:hypothetical protein